MSVPVARPRAEQLLAQALNVEVRLASDPTALSAPASDPARVAHVLAELSRSGVPVTAFSLGQPSLDEAFLALTGRPVGNPTATKEEAA